MNHYDVQSTLSLQVLLSPMNQYVRCTLLFHVLRLGKCIVLFITMTSDLHDNVCRFVSV